MISKTDAAGLTVARVRGEKAETAKKPSRIESKREKVFEMAFCLLGRAIGEMLNIFNTLGKIRKGMDLEV